MFFGCADFFGMPLIFITPILKCACCFSSILLPSYSDAWTSKSSLWSDSSSGDQLSVISKWLLLTSWDGTNWFITHCRNHCLCGFQLELYFQGRGYSNWIDWISCSMQSWWRWIDWSCCFDLQQLVKLKLWFYCLMWLAFHLWAWCRYWWLRLKSWLEMWEAWGKKEPLSMVTISLKAKYTFNTSTITDRIQAWWRWNRQANSKPNFSKSRIPYHPQKSNFLTVLPP